MRLKVACAQIAPALAKVGENLDLIADTILQASAEMIDLVVFPESAVSGYFLEGGVLECALSSAELREALAGRLVSLDRPIDCVVGFYETFEGKLYNSAVYLACRPGETVVVHTYRKFFLPTYGVFDEQRFVAEGRELGVFETRFGKVGIMICEDVWHSIMPTLHAVAGATLFIVPSASPGRGFSGDTVGNIELYRRLIKTITEEHGVFCVNAQLCGFESGKGFVGGSCIYDPFGNELASSPILEPHLLLANLDFDQLEIARSKAPMLSDLMNSWSALKRIAEKLD